MKTYFYLQSTSFPKQKGALNIIGKQPNDKPYVSISFTENGKTISQSFIDDRDLERVAVNILKALKSKHLVNT